MSSAISSIYDEISDWQVAYGPPNLITNSSFETNTTGWATGGANTIAQSAEQTKVGKYSLKCTYQDTASMGSFGITLTAVSHSLGMWVYVPSDYDGTDLEIDFANFTGLSPGTRTNVDMTKRDQWQLVIDENETPDAGDLIGDVRIRESGSAPTAGKFIYIDAAQCEAKAYPTPYCDGSLGTGHTWSGTAHNSTSSRTATELQYASGGINLQEGTIACWYKPTAVHPANNLTTWGPFALGALSYDVPRSIQAFYWKATGNLYIRLRDDNSYKTALNYSHVLDLSRWYLIVCTWKANDYFKVYYYDTAGFLTSNSIAMVTMTGSWAGPLYVGRGYADGGGYANGWLDDLQVLPYALNADEVELLWG